MDFNKKKKADSIEESIDEKLSKNEVTPPAHIWDKISDKLSRSEGIKKLNPRDEKDVKAS